MMQPTQSLMREDVSRGYGGASAVWCSLPEQNAPTIMADDKEAVEHAERRRRNGKEIHGGNGFPVITKKGKPTLSRLTVPRCSFHPAGNGCASSKLGAHLKSTAYKETL